MSDEGTPGWDAIEGACARAHPGVEPMHWATLHRWRLGGNDPLDGVSAYPVDGPAPHWHYVTYGLTELYEKESEDPTESGWGFELTFRLARTAAGEAAPVWPVDMLQNLARYVFESGNWFEPGHHIDANGPIAVGEPTRLTALLMAEDPELGTIATPNGRVVFVQGIGISADELDAVRQWRSDGFTDEIRRRNPLLVTDLGRASLLDDPSFLAAQQAGIAADGSSMGQLFVTSLAGEEVGGELVVRLGAIAVRPLLATLPGRLPHGRSLTLISDDRTTVDFAPGDVVGCRLEDAAVTVVLDPTALADLLGILRPVRGTYRVPSLPGFAFEVVPTEVRDTMGAVTEVIGE